MTGSSSGQNTTTTTSSPPPQVLQNYTNLTNAATSLAQQPLNLYTGPQVAGFTPQQTAGFSTIDASQGISSPFINSAAQEFGAATTPLWPTLPQFGAGTVNEYMSPYTGDVTSSLANLYNQQNATQEAQVAGNAASAGAYGGDRMAVAQALTAGQQNLTEAPTLAQVSQQGYQTGLGEFNTEQQQQLAAEQANAWLASQAGFGMAGLGSQADTAALTGANAELTAGGLQQQLAQEMLNIPEQEFVSTQAYPYQTLSFLSPIVEGTGSLSGGTGSTTYPGPSTLSQVAGLGIAGIGAYGLANNAGLFGSGSDASSIVSPLSSAGNYFSNFDSSGNFFDKRGGRVHRAFGGSMTTMPSIPGGISIKMPNVPGAGGPGVPQVANFIPQPAPGGTGNSMLSPMQPVVTTQSTSSGGGGILGDVGPLIGAANLALKLFAKGGGRIHFQDGGTATIIPGQTATSMTGGKSGLPAVPTLSIDQIIHPGPAIKGGGPPHPPSMSQQTENPVNEAMGMLGNVSKLKGFLGGDSSGSAEGGRIGLQDGGVPVMVAASLGGAPPNMQQAYQQLLELPLSRLQQMAVQFPPNTQQGQMVQQALRMKQATPGSGTSPTAPPATAPIGSAMAPTGMPSAGGTATSAQGQDYGGTAHTAAGGEVGDERGYVTPDELDPHPVVDHSGDTIKIRYPSEGKVLDLGLPSIKPEHERRQAGGSAGLYPQVSWNGGTGQWDVSGPNFGGGFGWGGFGGWGNPGGSGQVSFSPQFPNGQWGTSSMIAPNGVQIPQLWNGNAVNANTLGGGFGNVESGYGLTGIYGGQGGSPFNPLATPYSAVGAGPTGPNGTMQFASNAAFTPAMSGVLGGLNLGIPSYSAKRGGRLRFDEGGDVGTNDTMVTAQTPSPTPTDYIEPPGAAGMTGAAPATGGMTAVPGGTGMTATPVPSAPPSQLPAQPPAVAPPPAAPPSLPPPAPDTSKPPAAAPAKLSASAQEPLYTVGASQGWGLIRQGGLSGTTSDQQGADVDASIGRSPKATLEYINRQAQQNPDYWRGRKIVLDTGLQNDPSQVDLIPWQVEALKGAGANVVGINGFTAVGAQGTDMRPYVDRVQKMANDYQVPFGGLFTENVRPHDPVHLTPTGYQQMGNWWTSQTGATAAGPDRVVKPEQTIMLSSGEPVSKIAGRTTGPVTADLARQAGYTNDPEGYAALANYLWKGEASNFNILYGDHTFQSYAQHPADAGWQGDHGPDGRPTHAAGLPQFQPDTWHEEQQKLKLADFSPVNQVHAGLDLAISDYNKATGRDLLEDFKAGKYDDINRTLNGRWTSLGTGAVAGGGGGHGGLPVSLASYTGQPSAGGAAAAEGQVDYQAAIKHILDDIENRGKSGQSIYSSPWLPILAAGLGMLASRSPHPGVALGEGGLEGLKMLEEQQKSIPENELKEIQAATARMGLTLLPAKMGLAAQMAGETTPMGAAMTNAAGMPMAAGVHAGAAQPTATFASSPQSGLPLPTGFGHAEAGTPEAAYDRQYAEIDQAIANIRRAQILEPDKLAEHQATIAKLIESRASIMNQDPRMAGARAAAEAQGRLPYEVHMGRPGSIAFQGTTPVGAVPELRKMEPATGQPYYEWVSPPLGGNAAPAPAAPTAQPAPSAAGMAGAQTPAQGAAIPPTAAGPAGVNPLYSKAVDEQINSDHESIQKTLMPLADKANDTMATAREILNLSTTVPTGLGAQWKLEASRILSALGVPDDQVLGMRAEQGQEAQKLFLTLSAQAVRNMGAREPGSVISLFAHAYPNLETQPGAVKLMTNMLYMQGKRAQDEYLMAENQHAQAVAALGSGRPYQPLGPALAEFNNGAHSSENYLRAAQAMAGDRAAWSGLSRDQAEALAQLVPAGVQYTLPSGQLATN